MGKSFPTNTEIWQAAPFVSLGHRRFAHVHAGYERLPDFFLLKPVTQKSNIGVEVMATVGGAELISTIEAAERLGITQGRVRQICRGYRTPKRFGKKIGRDWFLSPKDLRQIADEVLRKVESKE